MAAVARQSPKPDFRAGAFGGKGRASDPVGSDLICRPNAANRHGTAFAYAMISYDPGRSGSMRGFSGRFHDAIP